MAARGTATLITFVLVAAQGCSAGAGSDASGTSPSSGGSTALARPGVSEHGDRARAATRLLRAVERHLTGAATDPHRLTGGSTTALAELSSAAANVAALGVTGLRLRYLGESSVPPPADVHDGGAAWVADVEVSWRLAGVDSGASTLVVPIVLSQAGHQAVLRTIRFAAGRQVPLWLLPPLAVRRTDSGLVAAADPSRIEALSALQERAAAAARSAVPGWTGPLVMVASATEEHYSAASGVAVGDDNLPEAVAAVTTTADGHRSAGSAVRVHLHPSTFWQLGPRGQQLVATHEAAHVALGSLLRPVPTWLAEGMADHVALRDSGIPIRDSAAGALRMVRRAGLPRALPTHEQLAGSRRDAGAWYEAARLAVRTLADRYGEAALLDFYRSVARTGTTDQAFEEVLGTTEAEVVAAWRADLAELVTASPASAAR